MNWFTNSFAAARQSFLALGDFVFPPICLLCGESANGRPWLFCQECEIQIYSDFHRCQKCATPVPEVVPNEDCFRCRKQKWKFSSVIALSPYREPMTKVVKEMKRPSGRLFRRCVGMMLADAAEKQWGKQHQRSSSQLELFEKDGAPKDTSQGRNAAEDFPLVIPVPNYWTHSIFGAANAAGELARQVSQMTGWELRGDIIRKIRKTDKQGTLAWSERPKNVRDAFQIVDEESLVERHIILVDDVLTSGATAAEISRVMMRSRAKSVTLCVAARGTGTKEVADSVTNPPDATKNPAKVSSPTHRQDSDPKVIAGTS